MRHIRQPAGSRICGQACLAMLAGIALEEAVRVVGHRRGTKTREILAALDKLGVPHAPRLRPIRGGQVIKVPSLLVVRFGQRRGSWHWVVLNGVDMLDPALEVPAHFDVYVQALQPHISSQLEIG